MRGWDLSPNTWAGFFSFKGVNFVKTPVSLQNTKVKIKADITYSYRGMASLSEAKYVGGVGALLFIFSFLPLMELEFELAAVGMIGYVLMLLALKWISSSVQNPAIFKNALTSLIVGIVGVVNAVLIGGVDVLSGDVDLIALFILNHYNLLSTKILLAFIAMWAFGIVSAIYFRRALYLAADHLNVKMFRTAGLLIIIEAILTAILLEAGLILSFAAYVLLAIAFFLLRESPLLQPAPATASIPIMQKNDNDTRSAMQTAAMEALHAIQGPPSRIKIISRSDQMICISCGEPSPVEADRCRSCGTPFKKSFSGLRCPVCAAPFSSLKMLSKGHYVCSQCFSDLKVETS